MSRLWRTVRGVGAASGAIAQSRDAFNPQPQAQPTTLASQADGRILLGGYFLDASSTLSGVERLNVDGSLDAGFTGTAVDSDVKAVAIQADGKILIGGSFTLVDGQAHHSLARLNANGTLDASFADPNLDDAVWAIAIPPDGNVLAAGDVLHVGATARSYAATFTTAGGPDGSSADSHIG